MTPLAGPGVTCGGSDAACVQAPDRWGGVWTRWLDPQVCEGRGAGRGLPPRRPAVATVFPAAAEGRRGAEPGAGGADEAWRREGSPVQGGGGSREQSAPLLSGEGGELRRGCWRGVSRKGCRVHRAFVCCLNAQLRHGGLGEHSGCCQAQFWDTGAKSFQGSDPGGSGLRLGGGARQYPAVGCRIVAVPHAAA